MSIRMDVFVLSAGAIGGITGVAGRSLDTDRSFWRIYAHSALGAVFRSVLMVDGELETKGMTNPLVELLLSIRIYILVWLTAAWRSGSVQGS